MCPFIHHVHVCTSVYQTAIRMCRSAEQPKWFLKSLLRVVVSSLKKNKTFFLISVKWTNRSPVLDVCLPVVSNFPVLESTAMNKLSPRCGTSTDTGGRGGQLRNTSVRRFFHNRNRTRRITGNNLHR